VRLNKKAPDAAACIRVIQTRHEPGDPSNRMERSPFLAAFILDEPVDIDRVWLWQLRRISEKEYRFRCAEHEWAKQFAPEDPIANPTRPVDLTKIEVVLP
jgi:hypothetical protein